MVTHRQQKTRHLAWAPLMRNVMVLSLTLPLLAWSAATVDLSDYDPVSAVSVSSPNDSTLKAQWSDMGGTQYRVQFSLDSGGALFRRLETAPASGHPFTTVAQNVASRFRVTLGTRHAQIGWPHIFFDKVFENKPAPGHYTMAEHFHPEFTQAYLNSQDTITPFKETMKSLGVQILHSSEFHLNRNQMHPFKNTKERLAELHAMYTLFQRESDEDLVLIPGEEYNHYFGGHWSYLFPKPVYFTGWPDQAGKAYKQTDVESGGVTYAQVYQVSSVEAMLRLLNDEGGLAWGSHPRIKDSQQTPDMYYDRVPEHTVLDLAKLPSNLTLRANTSPLILDQVTISLDGVTTSLTQWPYCPDTLCREQGPARLSLLRLCTQCTGYWHACHQSHAPSPGTRACPLRWSFL